MACRYLFCLLGTTCLLDAWVHLPATILQPAACRLPACPVCLLVLLFSAGMHSLHLCLPLGVLHIRFSFWRNAWCLPGILPCCSAWNSTTTGLPSLTCLMPSCTCNLTSLGGGMPATMRCQICLPACSHSLPFLVHCTMPPYATILPFTCHLGGDDAFSPDLCGGATFLGYHSTAASHLEVLGVLSACHSGCVGGRAHLPAACHHCLGGRLLSAILLPGRGAMWGGRRATCTPGHHLPTCPLGGFSAPSSACSHCHTIPPLALISASCHCCLHYDFILCLFTCAASCYLPLGTAWRCHLRCCCVMGDYCWISATHHLPVGLPACTWAACLFIPPSDFYLRACLLLSGWRYRRVPACLPACVIPCCCVQAWRRLYTCHSTLPASCHWKVPVGGGHWEEFCLLHSLWEVLLLACLSGGDFSVGGVLGGAYRLPVHLVGRPAPQWGYIYLPTTRLPYCLPVPAWQSYHAAEA